MNGEVNIDLKLVRENRWVKEYITPWGVYRDSKYRSGLCEPMSSEFQSAWRSASSSEQDDMIHSLRFFPWFCKTEFDKITSFLSTINGRLSLEVELSWIGREDGELQAHEERFLRNLVRWLMSKGFQRRLIGANRWFRVYFDESGLFFEATERWMSKPSEFEWEVLIGSATNPAYREAIKLVRANPFLVSKFGMIREGGVVRKSVDGEAPEL